MRIQTLNKNQTVTNNHNNSTSTSSGLGISFASLLTNNKVKVEKIPEGKMIDFLDNCHAFASFSLTDEKLFRNILADDKIIMNDIEMLSYTQVEKLALLIISHLDSNKLPLISISSQIFDMIKSTKITKNKSFNQAIYETTKEIDSVVDRLTILGDVKSNLSEFYMKNKDCENSNKEFNDFNNLDCRNFFDKVINIHETSIKNLKILPQLIEEHQLILNAYKIIQKHYDDIETKI